MARMCLLKSGKRREFAEEALQEALLRAIDKAHTFKGTSQLSTWLIQIASNVTSNYMRGDRKRAKKEVRMETRSNFHDEETIAGKRHADGYFIDPAPAADIQLEEYAQGAALEQAICMLPKQQRTIVCLVLFKGLQLNAVAKQLDVSYNATKASYRCAVLKLREQLTLKE